MLIFDTPEALQAHRAVSQRVRDLEVVQQAAGRVEVLLSNDNPSADGEWNAMKIQQAIQESLARLDGSNTAIVSMLTGFSSAELADLGGVPED